MAIYKFRKLKELYEPYNKMCRNCVTRGEYNAHTYILPYPLIKILFPDLSYLTWTSRVKVMCTGFHELAVLLEDTMRKRQSIITATGINNRVQRMFSEKKECVEW